MFRLEVDVVGTKEAKEVARNLRLAVTDKQLLVPQIQFLQTVQEALIF